MVPLIVLLVAIAMVAVERLWPGARLPRVAGWWPRTLFLNGIQAAAVWLGGVVWEPWIAGHRVMDGSGLGSVWGTVVGYVTITFVFYWWHRARHEVAPLWQLFHQLHHSPARLEVFTSFYKHPLEMMANSALSAVVLYLLVGLTPEMATGVVLMTGLAELFYHWNVRTPRWLGYLLQRPEMHRVHHATDHHTQNFSDLPLWDLLFGTFHNPAHAEGSCGFSGNREQAFVPMLRGEDVHSPKDKTRIAPFAWLLLLGGAAMLGDVSGFTPLQGLALATGASPAPKVFTARKGVEPFSSRFEIRWHDRAGEPRQLRLSPERASQLRGPYNRRNVVGAMIAGAPVMVNDPLLEPMFREVSRWAFCGERPLFRELGVAPENVTEPIHIVAYARPASGTGPRHQLAIPVHCEGSP